VTAPDWDSLLHRAGVSTRAPHSKNATRSVETATKRLNGTASDTQIELALLIAASNGQLRERLTDTQTRDSEAAAALRAAAASGKAEPVFARSTISANVVAILVLAVGPILVFPSVRTSNDFLINDLATAAVASGVLMVIAAAWFASVELFLTPWGGTRRGIYGATFFVVPIVLSALGIASTLYRMREYGAFGTIAMGATLQFVALVLYIVALLAALRNRKEAAAMKAEAGLKAPELQRARQVAHLRRDTKWALGKAPASEIDRGAASAGLRALYESGKLPADRVETILRSIA
jgi:hypothetical protein